jgi:hypothetical protein
MRRLLARWRCHRDLWCCQYVDRPMCNGWDDPHRLARWRYRRQQRRLDVDSTYVFEATIVYDARRR